eukprot:g68186.t1
MHAISEITVAFFILAAFLITGAVFLCYTPFKVRYVYKRLDLSGKSLGDSGAFAVAKGLQVNKQFLNLCDNSIGVEGAKAIAAALEENETLRELDMYRNNIGLDGAKAIAKALEYWTLTQPLPTRSTKCFGFGKSTRLKMSLSVSLHVYLMVFLPERKPDMISLSLTSRFAWRKLGKDHIGASFLQRFMKVSSERFRLCTCFLSSPPWCSRSKAYTSASTNALLWAAQPQFLPPIWMVNGSRHFLLCSRRLDRGSSWRELANIARYQE